MQTELFAIVDGFDGYLVSNCGRVVSLKTGRELAWQIMPNGYAVVCLHKNNQRSRALVHRLVAKAFIDNPDSLPEVNHKDGDKLNNSVSNLEWMSREQNLRHAVDTGLFDTEARRSHLADMTFLAAATHRKPVIRDDGVFFESVKAAADSVGGGHQNVSAVCKGRARSCMGHTFRYATDEEVRRCRALAEKEDKNE